MINRTYFMLARSRDDAGGVRRNVSTICKYKSWLPKPFEAFDYMSNIVEREFDHSLFHVLKFERVK